MITEKATIKCECVYNEDRTHRLSWRRIWDKEKPMACVIMINPNMSDNIVTDRTTRLVENNICRLESYGGVCIVNLFSLLTPKLQMRWARDIDINDPENDKHIKKAAEEASIVILAWGKSAENNARILARANQIIELLAPYKEKFRVISDGKRNGLHPLAPACSMHWKLTNFEPDAKDETE